MPKNAPKDERAIYDFIQELYRTRRVSDRTYAKVAAFLSNAATVELVGVLGYYTLISMTLNVFQMLPPADAELAFAEQGSNGGSLHLHAAHVAVACLAVVAAGRCRADPGDR